MSVFICFECYGFCFRLIVTLNVSWFPFIHTTEPQHECFDSSPNQYHAHNLKKVHVVVCGRRHTVVVVVNKLSTR